MTYLGKYFELQLEYEYDPDICINNNLKFSNSILDREFKQKVAIVDTNSNITINYNNNDLYMLSLTDNETRINNLYNEFYCI